MQLVEQAPGSHRVTGIAIEIRRKGEPPVRVVRCSHPRAAPVVYQPREGGAPVVRLVCPCGAEWRESA